MAKTSLKGLKNIIREELVSYLREQKAKKLNELESTTNAADDQKVAALKQKKADLEKKAAQNDGEIAKIKTQIDAIEKK